MSVVASSSFMAGAYANRVFVGLIQSIAGNHVPVPAPELQIIQSTWSINTNTSQVTDVDLLVTTNSSIWQLKLYQIHLQVSCLNTAGKEFICATGETKIVLPTHNIGLRPVKINLNQPIDPEMTEIEDLSFIVTDLANVAGQPPTSFGGPGAAEVTLAPNSTILIPVEVVGVTGVPAGTQVTLNPQPLPPGTGLEVTPASQTLTLQASKMPGVVMADSFFDVFAEASAMIGTTDLTVGITDPTAKPLDTFMMRFHVASPSPNPGAALPNLFFPSCALPPALNTAAACIEVNPPQIFSFIVGNNGPVSTPGPTTGKVLWPPGSTPLISMFPIPQLASGATTTIIVSDSGCNSSPDCSVSIQLNPNPDFAEITFTDNTIFASHVG